MAGRISYRFYHTKAALKAAPSQDHTATTLICSLLRRGQRWWGDSAYPGQGWHTHLCFSPVTALGDTPPRFPCLWPCSSGQAQSSESSQASTYILFPLLPLAKASHTVSPRARLGRQHRVVWQRMAEALALVLQPTTGW